MSGQHQWPDDDGCRNCRMERRSLLPAKKQRISSSAVSLKITLPGGREAAVSLVGRAFTFRLILRGVIRQEITSSLYTEYCSQNTRNSCDSGLAAAAQSDGLPRAVCACTSAARRSVALRRTRRTCFPCYLYFADCSHGLLPRNTFCSMTLPVMGVAGLDILLWQYVFAYDLCAVCRSL